MIRIVSTAVSAASCILLMGIAHAAQIDIAGPPGSGEFGSRVTLLPNGNFVVTDPGFDAPGGIADAGAVYLYRPDGGLIYSVRGSSANDQVGSGSVTVLSNGNFVISSPDWDNGGVFDAGAATWCNGVSGSSFVVNASNSTVGGSAGNRVGNGAVPLTNGNYVVISYEWDSSSVIDAGAATWGNGSIGSSGVVSAANSLVGTSAGDQVGLGAVASLTNGNYVVSSPKWDRGGAIDVGAATWGNGQSGVSGPVTVGNSYVGTTAGDLVGEPLVALRNGHYVVGGYLWDNGNIVNAGAVAWGNGTVGSTGPVSASNALVGGSDNDQLGGFVSALNNGHYVVNSPSWDNGSIIDAGAVTWANGETGATGMLSVANSLVGTSSNDQVGGIFVDVLSNGNYVVNSPFWDNGSVVDAGAVTWRSGTGSSAGVVSASNSLVGSSANDKVGNFGICNYGGTALSNGNYVVRSSEWDNGAMVDVGAVTSRSGAGGSGAVVSPGNSLIGSSPNDLLGCGGVTALSNGHYVVNSPYWNNGANADVGAVTWRNGGSASSGVVSLGNSLIGGTVSDRVGFYSTALSNGNYVIGSLNWRNGSTLNAGAVTWGNGASGSTGVVSSSNSLVGGTTSDFVGNGVTAAQSNGNYVAFATGWDNGGIVNAGAVSLGFGSGGTTGPITAANSVRGTATNGGSRMNYAYDSLRAQLIVGRPASSIVTLLRPGAVTSASIVTNTPDPSSPGEVVTFVVTVIASPAPSAASVRIAADSGENCTDNTPTVTGATSAQFSCQIVFTSVGERSVRAEFLGTNTHGYSASGLEPHSVTADSFADGFE